ncbi:hypothetical protein [Rheinheimera maricola]|uniref:Uncharacterized protein n=1 Tax=Rheinheimera maricola TaxID=2793282 RepID=A0ABS7XA38_9GAMM|nr:hypothetical protein [Rheinheimera maricola]MBZ9612406.1 hypothetical protein [Rheinheimera maricola]
MARFALYTIHFLALLCAPLPTVAQFNQCNIDTPSAVYGAQTWLELGHPLNMTTERLGRLPDSAGAKLIALAYQGWQQGKTEQQISTDVMALCKTFSEDELFADVIESPWPVLRTVCSDASENLVMALNEAGSASAAVVLFQLKGEEPAPNLLPMAEQAAALKQQNTADMQILEQLYASCAAKTDSAKLALGQEFYMQ